MLFNIGDEVFPTGLDGFLGAYVGKAFFDPGPVGQFFSKCVYYSVGSAESDIDQETVAVQRTAEISVAIAIKRRELSVRVGVFSEDTVFDALRELVESNRAFLVRAVAEGTNAPAAGSLE